MKQLLIIALGVLLIFGCSKPPQNLPGNHIDALRGPVGDSAMVASSHPIASQVGANIMKRGGNAFDAAIAVQFALAVVFPVAGNIGGGGFAVIRENNGNLASLDFRKKAPKAAIHDMYLNETGNVIQGKSIIGRLACGVPGSVDGMFALHVKYGSLPMAELIQPAIELADGGFVLTNNEASNLNRFQKEFKE